MEHVVPLRAADGWTAVARVTALLVSGDPADADRALPAVLRAALQELVDGAGLRSAVLRSVGTGGSTGELLAVAGEVVTAVRERPEVPTVPAQRSAADALDVRGAGGALLATLTVTGAGPATLTALETCAGVLGLALAADDSAARSRAAGLLDSAEDDRAELADALHDGVVQDLLVTRFAVDLAERDGDLPALREALQLSLVGLRRALWHLRPRGRSDLVGALGDLSTRLTEAGLPAPRLRVRAGGDGLTGSGAAAAYRLVQTLALLPGGTSLGLVLDRSGDDVVLDVLGAAALPDLERWRQRAAALGGELTGGPGRLRLVLPVPAPTAVDVVQPAPLRSPAPVPASSRALAARVAVTAQMTAAVLPPAPAQIVLPVHAARRSRTARPPRTTNGPATLRPDVPTAKAAP